MEISKLGGGDSLIRNSSIKDIYLAPHIDNNKVIYLINTTNVDSSPPQEPLVAPAPATFQTPSFIYLSIDSFIKFIYPPNY